MTPPLSLSSSLCPINTMTPTWPKRRENTDDHTGSSGRALVGGHLQGMDLVSDWPRVTSAWSGSPTHLLLEVGSSDRLKSGGLPCHFWPVTNMKKYSREIPDWSRVTPAQCSPTDPRSKCPSTRAAPAQSWKKWQENFLWKVFWAILLKLAFKRIR